MQIQAENYKLFLNTINQARDILVLVGGDKLVDTQAAALYLQNLLSSLGKKVQIVVRGELVASLRQYTDKISAKIEPAKLVVSFNWHKTGVDKVSYDLKGDRFNFIVTPRSKKINPEEVKIFNQGQEPDLVVTLGVPSLSSLQNDEEEFIETKTIINIDNKSQNQLFGRLNFVNEDADSICSLIAKLTEKNHLIPSEEAADLLLLGIREATNNFSAVNDPATFEAAAFCAKAKKGQVTVPEQKQYKVKTQIPNEWLAPKIFRSKQQAS